MQRELQIRGMHCLDCAVKVKNALAGVPGVQRAEVKYVRKRATVQVDESVPVTALVEAVQKAGYGAEPL
ncbi:MAG: cation transporter [Firmicutes bacterium]|nr:cation transporter [Bacillota bacterium]